MPAVAVTFRVPLVAAKQFERPLAIAFLVVLTILVPFRHAQAAGSAPVTVVNTPADPVPVTPVGTTPITGSVSVTNTSANPVPITGSVKISGTPSTVMAYDQKFTSVAGGSTVNTSLINVSTFKQIRVVVGARNINFCFAYLETHDDAGNFLGFLDVSPASLKNGDDCVLNKAYDTPGAALKVEINNTLQTANDFRVTVYGQPY